MVAAHAPLDAPAHLDDVALLRATADRDPVAVRELLDRIAPVVYGFVYGRVGGDESAAEDVLQETLLEAVRSAGTYRGDAALTTWMCAIARRRLARFYASERKAESARVGLYLVEAPAEDEAFDERDEVVRALRRLPVLHRQVLVLKYLDDASVEQIATMLGRTRVQVQSLLQRARDGLRRELSDDR